MKEFSYTLTDPLGIHARPAGLFIKELEKFSSTVTIRRNQDRIEGKRLLALMKLRVKQGETITVNFEGADEEAAAEAAEAFLKENL